MQTMRRLGSVLVGVAAVVALAAAPAPAAAGSKKRCQPVTDGDIGAAEVKAYGIKCTPARRHVRRCISKGELRPGWNASLDRRRGKLKLTKNDRKIVAVLEGGYTDTFKRCLADSRAKLVTQGEPASAG